MGPSVQLTLSHPWDEAAALISFCWEDRRRSGSPRIYDAQVPSGSRGRNLAPAVFSFPNPAMSVWTSLDKMEVDDEDVNMSDKISELVNIHCHLFI